MKTKSKISSYVIRSAASAVFLSVAFIALSSASNSPNRWQRSTETTRAYDTTGNTSSQPRAFSFAERVAYQRAIEDVYWRHRIWPKENPDPKPSLDGVGDTIPARTVGQPLAPPTRPLPDTSPALL
jgi:hypothetical protein